MRREGGREGRSDHNKLVPSPLRASVSNCNKGCARRATLRVIDCAYNLVKPGIRSTGDLRKANF